MENRGEIESYLHNKAPPRIMAEYTATVPPMEPLAFALLSCCSPCLLVLLVWSCVCCCSSCACVCCCVVCSGCSSLLVAYDLLAISCTGNTDNKE